MANQPKRTDSADVDPVERLLEEDASNARSGTPADLDDRIFVASQRALAATRPPIVVRRLRWMAPLAAAAMLAIATTLFWPTGVIGPAPIDEGAVALLETDIESVVLAADIEEELADLDAFLESLDELEESFAMNWTDDISLLESEFDIEETVQ